MNITATFSLEPKLQDSVWYIQWSADIYGDAKIRARWNAYARKHCSGKDAFGKYYDSRKHALKVIREFKKLESTRKEKA